MASKGSYWRSFLDRPNDDRIKIFGVAIILAFVCSLAISLVTVSLRPIQQANLAAEREARMASMIDALPGMRTLLQESGVDGLETSLVDLATGKVVSAGDVEAYDYDAVTVDPAASVEIPADIDVAGLKRRPELVPVYFLAREDELFLLVLPVRGRGYQSTIKAMLALEADLKTIAALVILEQEETPGLGARIEDADWQALWPGKQLTDQDGQLIIDVVKGDASGPYEVDGISGATVTSNGVANMLRYWMGDHGFGALLQRIKSGEF